MSKYSSVIIRLAFLGISLLLMVVVVVAVISFVANHSQKKKLDSFEDEVKQSVDPVKLQEWALAIVESHDNGYELPVDSLPDYLLKLHNGGPSSAFVSAWNGTNTRCLIVSWGGGFGHHGIIVGKKGFSIPEHDSFELIDTWTPGVYFLWQTK